MKILLLLVLFPVLTCIAESEEPFWEYIGGPPTGDISNMAINNNGDLFISGSSGFYRSTDRGERWNNILRYYAASAYSLSITSDNTVFAITGDSNSEEFGTGKGFFLHKSTDNGDTWQIIYGPWFDKKDNKYIPASIRTDKDNNIYLIAAQEQNGAKIYLSTDNGKTWSEQSVINDIDGSGLNIPLFVGSKGYLALSYNCYSTNQNTNYIFKISPDSGKTWKNRYTNLLFNDICFLSKDTMLVTLYKYPDIDYGFGLTTDGGETFTYDNRFVMPEKILHPNPQEIYVTSTWGLYYSSDNGKSWRHNLINDFDSLKESFWTIYTSPNWIRNIVQDKQGRLYVTPLEQGVYLSDDKGKNWIRSNKGFTSGRYFDMCIDTKGNLYVSGLGLFRSPDKGKSWETLGFLSNMIYTIDVTKDGTIYAGSGIATGLFRSTNNGMTWDTLMSTGGNSAPYLNKSLFGRNGNLYYEDIFNGFYVSTDRGDSWIKRKQPGNEVIAENSEGHIFVGTEDMQNIWRSTNDGLSWDSVIYSDCNFSADHVALMFKPNQTIGYAVTNFCDTIEHNHSPTLWQTKDNGRSWIIIPDGYDRFNLFNTKFVIDSLGNIWNNISLFNEKDYTWQKFDSGYQGIGFIDEEVSPDGYLYMLDGNGIYKSRDRFVSVEDITQPAELTFSNYPNPFENETEIEYSLPSPANVRIAVYDIFGREIEVIENEYKDAGKHRAKCKADGLVSGVYYYTIEAGGNKMTKPLVIHR